jgi:hypothetical protein
MAAKEVVSITLQADIKDLKRELESIPGITKREAGKMARELQTQYNKAERAAKKAAKSTKVAWKDTARGAAKVGAAVLGAAVAVVAFAQKMADLNNELTDAATRTGLTIDQLAGLRLAAEGSGLTFAALEKGLNNLPKAMNDAAKGTGTARDAFAKMNIDVRNLATGGLRDTSEVLPEIIAGLNKLPDAASKSAAAMDIFGTKAGGALIQSGALENMDAFVSLATEFGVGVGPKATQSAAMFQRQMATLKTVTQGTAAALGESLGGMDGLSGIMLELSKGLVFVSKLFPLLTESLKASFAPLRTALALAQGVAETYTNLAQGNFVAALDSAATGFANAAIVIKTSASTIIDTPGRVATAWKEANDGVKRFTELADKANAAGGPRTGGGGADPVAMNQAATVAIDERIKALTRLRSAQEKASFARLDAQSKIIAKFTEQQAIIDAAEEAGASRDEVAVARHESQVARLTAMHDLQMMQSDERQKKLEEEEANARATSLAVVSASGDAMGSIATLFGMAAENAAKAGSKADKRAAMSLFRAQKAAALAVVGLRAAEGFMTAASLPPPADVVKGISVGLAATTASAAIAAAQPPAFDIGGVINGGTPDQIPINVLPGEAVLKREAVNRLGTQGVNDLNSGTGGGGRMIVEQRYRHRSYNAFTQDNLMMASSPLRDAVSNRSTPAGRAT